MNRASAASHPLVVFGLTAAAATERSGGGLGWWSNDATGEGKARKGEETRHSKDDSTNDDVCSVCSVDCTCACFLCAVCAVCVAADSMNPAQPKKSLGGGGCTTHTQQSTEQSRRTGQENTSIQARQTYAGRWGRGTASTQLRACLPQWPSSGMVCQGSDFGCRPGIRTKRRRGVDDERALALPFTISSAASVAPSSDSVPVDGRVPLTPKRAGLASPDD
jgi:hypothetical protein